MLISTLNWIIRCVRLTTALIFTVTISKWRVVPMVMKVKVELQTTLREQKSQRMKRVLTLRDRGAAARIRKG